MQPRRRSGECWDFYILWFKIKTSSHWDWTQCPNICGASSQSSCFISIYSGRLAATSAVEDLHWSKHGFSQACFRRGWAHFALCPSRNVTSDLFKVAYRVGWNGLPVFKCRREISRRNPAVVRRTVDKEQRESVSDCESRFSSLELMKKHVV